MDFDAIIRDFADSEVVPEDAVRAALAAGAGFVDAAIPLLERVSSVRASDVEWRAVGVLVHVLGEIGDRRALPALVGVLALPGAEVEDLLGDTITEGLSRILLSLANGDAAALEEALAAGFPDPFVTGAVLDAWTALALGGQVSRDAAALYMADFATRPGLEPGGPEWSAWADSVAVLGLRQLADVAGRHLPRRKPRRSALEAPAVTFEDFEEMLAETRLDPLRWKDEPRYRPFTDTIGELSGWYGYSEAYRQEQARMAERGGDAGEDAASFLDDPFIAHNPYRDVGRNDPCPCGSGKKFKKCCLGEAAG